MQVIYIVKSNEKLKTEPFKKNYGVFFEKKR